MKPTSAKVTVIIPVYQTERYLADCLDSVLNQSLQDVEIICVDDASPDRCGEILDEYAAKDARIQVVHLSENHGQGFARNLGIERARGKYLYFLDSDDFIDSETFEELSKQADRDNLDVIFFDSKEKYETEELKEIYVPPFSFRVGKYRDEVVTGSELLKEFLLQDEWTCYPQRIFWRREFLLENEARYLEGCLHEDEFFAFSGILTAKRARYVRKQYFTLRIRPNSAMTSPKSPKNFYGYLMNFYYMSEFVAKRGLDGYSADVCIAIMLNSAMTLYETLKDRFNLEEQFVKEPDKTVYRHFMGYVRVEYGKYGVYSIDPEVLAEIQKYRIVYVYGVDQLAQETCERLERYNVLIGGFLTNDQGAAPSTVMGRNVLELDSVTIPNDGLVVVESRVAGWEEIHETLANRNICHMKFEARAPSWTKNNSGPSSCKSRKSE